MKQLENQLKEKDKQIEELKSYNEELVSLFQSLEGKSEDDLKSQNIQLHRQANERVRKIEQLKTLIQGQHEIIENYKNAATTFEAEREAHAVETARLEKLHKEAKEKLQKEINLVSSS